MNPALNSAGFQQDILRRLDMGDLTLGGHRTMSGASRRRNGHAPTLAQKMGLVKAPPKPIGMDEWDEIERRLVRNGAFFRHCAICLNGYGRLGVKVALTSCGHVFHQSCLKATQAMSNPPNCPMCRGTYTQSLSKKGVRKTGTSFCYITFSAIFGEHYCQKSV